MTFDEPAHAACASPSDPPARPKSPTLAAKGSGESAADYLGRVRRYVRGSGHCDPADTGARLIDTAHCRVLLHDASVEFAPWLAQAGTSVEALVRGTPAQLAAALNHMRREASCLTMSSDAVIDNVLALAHDVLARGVPGDFIEAGAWRGGVALLMRATFEAWPDACVGRPRRVWVADSFAGLPRPDPASDLADAVMHHLMASIDSLRVDRRGVEHAFAAAGLLDERVLLLEGWFADTLPGAPTGPLALARLDGDWHESTMTALEALYPRLSPGGHLIVDDYGLPTGCARAVDTFRRTHGIEAPLRRVDHQAVYWSKPR